jgi:large subunit ribosomal protein L24
MSFAADRKRRTELRHEGWAQGRVRTLDLRTGDEVEVIAGKDKGKRGTVARTDPERQRITVNGVNKLKRHTRAGVKGAQQGGIVDFFAPMAYSNVQLVCPKCNKPTRLGHAEHEPGKVALVCRKCGARYERSATK